VFRIVCVFEKESGADVRDPLGDVEFSDGRSSILVRTTYLDSWIEGLIKSLVEIRTGKSTQVGIPEEPNSLHVEVGADGKVTVRGGDSVVTADDKRAFENALLEASRFFLSRIADKEDPSDNPAVQKIRNFCKTASQC
jgi:hypothetical protein